LTPDLVGASQGRIDKPIEDWPPREPCHRPSERWQDSPCQWPSPRSALGRWHSMVRVQPVAKLAKDPYGSIARVIGQVLSWARFHSAEPRALWCSPKYRPGNHHLTARPSDVRRHQQSGSQPHFLFRGLWSRWSADLDILAAYSRQRANLAVRCQGKVQGAGIGETLSYNGAACHSRRLR
jgi:hypothetical protein